MLDAKQQPIRRCSDLAYAATSLGAIPGCSLRHDQRRCRQLRVFSMHRWKPRWLAFGWLGVVPTSFQGKLPTASVQGGSTGAVLIESWCSDKYSCCGSWSCFMLDTLVPVRWQPGLSSFMLGIFTQQRTVSRQIIAPQDNAQQASLLPPAEDWRCHSRYDCSTLVIGDWFVR